MSKELQLTKNETMYTNKDFNAFPVFDAKGECSANSAGLTKREYFAAVAMQGLLATEAFEDNYSNITAQRAVIIADALLVELEKPATHETP